MKDLYLRLGVAPDAGAAEIAASDDDDKRADDYRSILLDPQRRDSYDRAFAVVKAIGILRGRLGLDSGPSWFQDHCPDFVPPIRAARLAERQARLDAQAGNAETKLEPEAAPVETKPRRWWLWVLLLALAATVVIYLMTGSVT